MFGSDYWLGSIDACIDLQLTKYYVNTPPFPLHFTALKLNISLHDGHLPQVRLVLITRNNFILNWNVIITYKIMNYIFNYSASFAEQSDADRRMSAFVLYHSCDPWYSTRGDRFGRASCLCSWSPGRSHIALLQTGSWALQYFHRPQVSNSRVWNKFMLS